MWCGGTVASCAIDAELYVTYIIYGVCYTMHFPCRLSGVLFLLLLVDVSFMGRNHDQPQHSVTHCAQLIGLGWPDHHNVKRYIDYLLKGS